MNRTVRVARESRVRKNLVARRFIASPSAFAFAPRPLLAQLAADAPRFLCCNVEHDDTRQAVRDVHNLDEEQCAIDIDEPLTIRSSGRRRMSSIRRMRCVDHPSMRATAWTVTTCFVPTGGMRLGFRGRI